MKSFFIKSFCALALLFYCAARAHAHPHPPLPPPLQELAAQMSAEDGYPRAKLEAVLRDAKILPEIITAIQRPNEARPWHEYRALFISRERILSGARFWNAHAQTLARAETEYGVPAAVVVALLGIESHYGSRRGKYRVLDALATLTVDYPRRRAFFRAELREFLRTARAEGIDPRAPRGSYAGAVGIPQFMPSSYRAYAVDFNANGRRDLSGETADAIGSVGNYLKRHGWKAKRALVLDAPRPLPPRAAELVANSAKPTLRAAQLSEAGIPVNASGEKFALLALQESGGNRYIVTSANFYALTRYNPSVHYAMAIVELAHEIRRVREGGE